MQPAPVIHIVDDDHPFQLSVARLLRATGYTVQTYTSADAFLRANAEPAPEHTPACILMDVFMPGCNGLDLQKALAGRLDPLPIIFVSGHADIPTSVQAMKTGAIDFLIKPVARDVLLKAIQVALSWSEATRHIREQTRNWRARYETLTKREAEVLACVTAGKTNKQVATELDIAIRTVKAHRGQLMQKMGATSLAELVRIANRLQHPKTNPIVAAQNPS
jgi:FixJ family two-component response regulator